MRARSTHHEINTRPVTMRSNKGAMKANSGSPPLPNHQSVGRGTNESTNDAGKSSLSLPMSAPNECCMGATDV